MKVQVVGQNIKDIESFVHLGANVSKSGGTGEELKARLGKARIAYNKPGKIRMNSQLNILVQCHVGVILWM